MGFIENNWEIILSSLLTLASILYSIFYSVKSGKKSEVLSIIKSMIPSLVREAETIIKGDKMGAVRENYVLTRAILYATQHKVKLTTEELENLIREEVKTLNYGRVEETPSATASDVSVNEVNEASTEVDVVI